MTDTPAPPIDKGKLVMAVLTGLPYAEQIKDLDLDSEADAIRFTWRGIGLHVREYGDMPRVSEMQPGVLVGSAYAILAEQCVKHGWLINEGFLK